MKTSSHWLKKHTHTKNIKTIFYFVYRFRFPIPICKPNSHSLVIHILKANLWLYSIYTATVFLKIKLRDFCLGSFIYHMVIFLGILTPSWWSNVVIWPTLLRNLVVISAPPPIFKLGCRAFSIFCQIFYDFYTFLSY